MRETGRGVVAAVLFLAAPGCVETIAGGGTSTSSDTTTTSTSSGGGSGGDPSTSSTSSSNSSSDTTTTSTGTGGGGGGGGAGGAGGAGGGPPGPCSNGVKDGQETDIDCGGPSCPECATGQACVVDADCLMRPPGFTDPYFFVPGHCVNGTCGAQTLYTGACVTEWVVDGTSLYWTCASDGTVRSAPKDGSGPVTIVASGLSSPTGIAADAASLYWTDSMAGTLMSVPLGASGGSTLASGLGSPTLVHLGGGYAWMLSDHALLKAPIGGGAATLVASADPLNGPMTGVATDASNVYWSTPLTKDNSTDMCADGHLYYMPLGGGAISGIISPFPFAHPTRLITDGTGVYTYDVAAPPVGINCFGNGVIHLPLSGSLAVVYERFGYAFPGEGSPPDLPDQATDGATLYWNSNWGLGGGAVTKPGIVCNPTFSGVCPLVDVPASRIVVDDTYLYTFANGTIARSFK